MESDNQLIQCLLCEMSTLEESLMSHIQYNHMIYKAAIRQVMYKLHYPPVSKTCCNEMITACDKDKGKRRNSSISPFCVESSPGISAKRRRKSSGYEKNKKIKTENETPSKSKKPIVLKKHAPTRKRLQPILNGMMDEDPPAEGGNEDQQVGRGSKRRGVDYDDVYTRKENLEKHSSSVHKMRQLQQNEIECIMDHGTYVQCSECNKWRLVKEFEDPSLVPEYWICSMNKDDPEANDCDKGDGHDVSSDEDIVSVEYACGSMVWVKFSGYPWWPGMVDYCPEEEETFLVDEDTKVAAKYHVVFFDKATNVARAWIRKELVTKMVNSDEPPKPVGTFKNDNIKKRYQIAKTMAVDALNLPRIERIEKYSFASLYTGKWGDVSEDSEDLDRRSTDINIDTRLIGVGDFRQPPGVKKKLPAPKKVKRRRASQKMKEKRFLNTEALTGLEEHAWEKDFHCLKCSQSVKLSRNFVKNHLRRHRMNFTDYVLQFDTPENNDKLYHVRQWIQNEDYLSMLSEAAENRRKSCDEQSVGSKRTLSVEGESDPLDEEIPPILETISPTHENNSPPPVIEENSVDESEIGINNDNDNNVHENVHEEIISLANEDPSNENLNSSMSNRPNEEYFEAKEEPLDENNEESNEVVSCSPDALIIDPMQGASESPVNELYNEPEERENIAVEANQSTSFEPTESLEGDDLDRLRQNLEDLVKLKEKGMITSPTKMVRKVGDKEEETDTVAVAIEFPKPPMSPDLLIAIAVRNLDSHKEVGASCIDIVAFLSLHFPYFNSHNDECKDMVRKECGMGSSFESGRENFQMKAEINGVDKIYAYVQNNRERISGSMLEPEFLDIIIDRFVRKHSIILPSSRHMPPFSRRMLTHIALLKLHPRATLEQIIILLKFFFPALAQSGVMEAFRREFLEEIAKSDELNAKVEKNNNITFILRDTYRDRILEQIRGFALENLQGIGEALLSESLFDIALPIFENLD